MVEGIIFDIKRYAIHDGPGIRTTAFLKGCPLSCPWCHNPESINPEPEIMISQLRCNADCEICIGECPENVLAKRERLICLDKQKCRACGRCVDACVYDALQIAGRRIKAHDLISEIEKDRIFFDTSGGGVTLSGGEPLMQMPFVRELLPIMKSKEFHVAIDKSGYVPSDDMISIKEYVDLFLFDLKMMDRTAHVHYTGVPNDLILSNLRRVSEENIPVEIRVPLISGVNDTPSNIRQTAAFLKKSAIKARICLLPYHKGGCAKHIRLQPESRVSDFEAPSAKRVEKIKKELAEQGFDVKVGG